MEFTASNKITYVVASCTGCGGSFAIWKRHLKITDVVNCPICLAKVKVDGVRCFKCKDEMKLRKGPYSWFWGCSNYPECRGRRELAEIGICPLCNSALDIEHNVTDDIILRVKCKECSFTQETKRRTTDRPQNATPTAEPPQAPITSRQKFNSTSLDNELNQDIASRGNW